MMDRPPKTEKKPYLIPARFRPGARDFDLPRILTFVLAGALVLFILLTWLPAHLGENLIVPGEAMLLVLALFLNGLVYKRQPPYATRFIIASLVFQVIMIEV